RNRAIDAAVVDNDEAIREARLLTHRLETPHDVPFCVESDDDETDRHGNGAATSSPEGAAVPTAPNGVSMMPFGPAESTHTGPPCRRAPMLICRARSQGSGATASAGSATHDCSGA